MGIFETRADHPRLRGIYTTPDRAKSLEGLLKELGRHIKPHQQILAYNSIPLIHYITQTQPTLTNPWPLLMNKKSLETELNAFSAQCPMDLVVVRALTNTRNHHWGTKELPSDSWFAEKLENIDKTINACGYRKVWANRDFAIFRL